MTNPTEPDLMALAVTYANAAIDWYDAEENLTAWHQSLQAARDALQSALTTLQSKLDAAEARGRELDAAYAEPFSTYHQLQVRVQELEKDALVPDMYWDSDDAESPHDSIDEFLNHEICNGYLEVGAVFTLLQAKRFPNVTIKVTRINENECEAEWEEIDRAALSKETPK